MNELFKEMQALSEEPMEVGAFLWLVSKLEREEVLYKHFKYHFKRLSELDKRRLVQDIIENYKMNDLFK